MDARRKRRGFALSMGGFGVIMLIAGMVTAASAQVSPSSTTSIPASTAPATTVTQPSGPSPIEIGPLCRTIYQDPAAPDAPVVAQVLLSSTGEVVATRTGTGPYVPADFAPRCDTTTTSTSPSAPQCLDDGSIPPGATSCVDARVPILRAAPSPARPVPGRAQFTG